MKRRTPDHPKVIALASALKLPRWGVVGLLEMLWHFAAEFAPQGDVGRFSDEAIAKACHWGGDPSRLVSAWVACGWLEGCPTHRLVVHDWIDHIPDFVKKTLQRKGLAVVVSGQRRTTADNGCLPLPKPIPEPVPKPMPAPTPKPARTRPLALASEAPDNFSMYWEVCEMAEMQGSETDFQAARALWIRLSLTDQLAACMGIKDRIAAGELSDPAFRPLPQNFLKHKTWQRAIRERLSPAERREAALYKAIAKMDADEEEENRGGVN